MELKRKDRIPVYDICSLADVLQLHQDITAEDLGHYLARHPDLHFPHRHSFYHIVYFTGGGGTHTIDFETFPVMAGQVYIMVPGQVHTWNFSGPVNGYIINCSEELMHTCFRGAGYVQQFPLFNGIAADGVVQLHSAIAQVETLFKTIISEAEGNGAYRMELVRNSLVSLFIYIVRDAAATAQPVNVRQNQVVLQHFRRLVEQHFHTMRLPRDYAAMLYITPNHLNALCSDLLGKPAGEVIRERVLLEAKRLLVSSTAGIATIAGQLDFSDNSYFTKFFKKYTGITPEQFRAVR